MERKAKVYPKQHELEYLIANWNEKTITQMANDLRVDRDHVVQWAHKLRKNGANLPRKPKESIYSRVARQPKMNRYQIAVASSQVTSTLPTDHTNT